MNIQSRAAIQNHAHEAHKNGQDESACRYPYGSEERAVWIDAYCELLTEQDRN